MENSKNTKYKEIITSERVKRLNHLRNNINLVLKFAYNLQNIYCDNNTHIEDRVKALNTFNEKINLAILMVDANETEFIKKIILAFRNTIHDKSDKMSYFIQGNSGIDVKETDIRTSIYEFTMVSNDLIEREWDKIKEEAKS